MQVQEVPSDQPSYRDNDTIIEEGSEEEGGPEASGPFTPANDTKSNHLESSTHEPPAQSPSQTPSGAASELRIHELLALLTCFVSPLIGSWLLHHIRAQLSRPSEGLVSNYNLTIFVMAAELRPLSHLIKLVQARTLYLQRIVSSNPHQTSPSLSQQDTIDELTHRISELESQLPTTPNGTPKPPLNLAQQQQDLITATRKTLQPDVDALNRAVRRYEKRATLLTMQTESRLQGLEGKLADAITLAAAAERSSQASKQRRGSGVVVMLDWATSAVLIPVQLAWTVVSLPGQLVWGLVGYVEDVLGRKYKREMRTAGRAPDGSKLGVERRKMGRGAKKAM
ncbi:MAG: hypothetical protein OHK93_002848 [Ramalina farinacea]|uniref:Uncharacterized protein n=1 Tax=Ramalina farinacea TaxID=258253 RepID=A0AA43TXM3_9LECA|nr:hypothetical protein [Ramalina farinacea]